MQVIIILPELRPIIVQALNAAGAMANALGQHEHAGNYAELVAVIESANLIELPDELLSEAAEQAKAEQVAETAASTLVTINCVTGRHDQCTSWAECACDCHGAQDVDPSKPHTYRSYPLGLSCRYCDGSMSDPIHNTGR